MTMNSPFRGNDVAPVYTSRKRKLSGRQLDKIGLRRGQGESAQALALEYGVSAARIRDIAPRY